MEALTPEWVEAFVAASASAGADKPGDHNGIVEFTIGKKRRAAVSVVEGRVAAAADPDAEVDVTIPFTEAQLASYLSGSESIAQDYIRGDVKPVGSTGPWLAVVELMESGALKSLAP